MRSDNNPEPTGTEATDHLHRYITAKMAETQTPALAVCLVRRGEVQFAHAYGKANIREKRPCTLDTPFMLGSLAHGVVATAFMQLTEQGAVDLDDDISEYLEFPVRHPRFPSTPITCRMLLAHTTGIQDDARMLERHFVMGDSPVPLRKVVKWTLKTTGRHYDPVHGFSTWEPGTGYLFSNIGYAVLGHIIETIRGTPFDQYCTERIFKPLGMDTASWRLAQCDPNAVAMPYHVSRITGEWEPIGHYGYPDYPNHSLRASANELTRFLTAIMDQGALGDAKILQSQTVADMQSICYPECAPHQGLGWFYEEQPDGTRLVGHGGADHGVLHRMFFRPDSDTGVILLTNGDPSRKALWNLVAIENRLFEYSDALAAAHKPSLHLVERAEAPAQGSDIAPVVPLRQQKSR